MSDFKDANEKDVYIKAYKALFYSAEAAEEKKLYRLVASRLERNHFNDLQNIRNLSFGQYKIDLNLMYYEFLFTLSGLLSRDDVKKDEEFRKAYLAEKETVVNAAAEKKAADDAKARDAAHVLAETRKFEEQKLKLSRDIEIAKLEAQLNAAKLGPEVIPARETLAERRVRLQEELEVAQLEAKLKRVRKGRR